MKCNGLLVASIARPRQSAATGWLKQEVDRWVCEAGCRLVEKEELRVVLAAERSSGGASDIVVDLPEYGNPTIEFDPGLSTGETVAFKLSMKPTGRIVRYTIPRDVYEMLRAKWCHRTE